jgi:hypothetical protein
LWQRGCVLEALLVLFDQAEILGGLFAVSETGRQAYRELVETLGRLLHHLFFSEGLETNKALRNDSVPRWRMLDMLSENEPPALSLTFPASVAVDGLFALVQALYRHVPPLAGANGHHEREVALTPAQVVGQEMLSATWAPLLSALSLLLNSSQDEAFVQHTLKALQTLLGAAASLRLDQARDACLLALSRYALGQGNDELLSTKQVLCMKVFLHICHSFGSFVGPPWMGHRPAGHREPRCGRRPFGWRERAERTQIILKCAG